MFCIWYYVQHQSLLTEYSPDVKRSHTTSIFYAVDSRVSRSEENRLEKNVVEIMKTESKGIKLNLFLKSCFWLEGEADLLLKPFCLCFLRFKFIESWHSFVFLIYTDFGFGILLRVLEPNDSNEISDNLII